MFFELYAIEPDMRRPIGCKENVKRKFRNRYFFRLHSSNIEIAKSVLTSKLKKLYRRRGEGRGNCNEAG